MCIFFFFCSWLDFTNKDLWRRLFLMTAGMLMANLTDAGQASLDTTTAVKGLVWYGCWGSLDLSPAAFLPKAGPAGVLKSGDDLVDSAVPGLTVSSKSWPLVVVNVAGTEGLEGVIKTFLWCLSVTVASGEFTIQAYLGQAMTSILETCPAQHSCNFSNMASMLVIPAWSMTLTLVT